MFVLNTPFYMMLLVKLVTEPTHRKNMIAYIGPKLTDGNRALMKLLHEKGVMCMVSAAPTFDKLPDAAGRAKSYREIFEAGVDILESDLPIEVAEAVNIVKR